MAITSSGARPEFRARNNPNEIALGAPKQNATTLAGILARPGCILRGVRPQIAQAIAHLGIDLKNVPPKAAQESALQVAINFLALRPERSR